MITVVFADSYIQCHEWNLLSLLIKIAKLIVGSQVGRDACRIIDDCSLGDRIEAGVRLKPLKPTLSGNQSIPSRVSLLKNASQKS